MDKGMSKADKERLHATLRKDLEEVLNCIWYATRNMTNNELAEAAGLSVQTVDRLYYGTWVTPHARTIQKLGRVVGYRLSFTDKGVEVKVNKRQLVKALS